jgi:hypothetical protein
LVVAAVVAAFFADTVVAAVVEFISVSPDDTVVVTEVEVTSSFISSISGLSSPVTIVTFCATICSVSSAVSSDTARQTVPTPGQGSL